MNQAFTEDGMRRRAGAVMLEFIVSFPIILMLILGAIQIAHVWLARVVVHYAAYCAARTAMVSMDNEYLPAARNAAEQVLSWVHVGQESGRTVPGWGNIPGSGGVAADTLSVTITETPDWNVRAEVQYRFNLITPIIGPLMANAVSPQLNLIPTDTGDWGIPFPQILLTETVYLPKPFRCTMPAQWP